MLHSASLRLMELTSAGFVCCRLSVLYGGVVCEAHGICKDPEGAGNAFR